MAQKDFYSTLNIPRTASDDEIKKAYRKLAMRYHPDKNPGNKAAEEKFKEISEAYEVLKDPKRRQLYDQFGQTVGAGAGGPQGHPFEGFDFGGPSGFGGFGGGANPNDIFSEFFGDVFAGGPRRRGDFRDQRGSDLRYTLAITLEEAAIGTEKTISFVRRRNGKQDQAKLAITVPAGVREGQRLKLKGEGDANGSSIGDLYVIINFQEHSLFRRRENDIFMDLPISFADAILGTTLEIPTLTGVAQLRVPAGTHPSQVFRLKGKGFPEMGGYGAGDMLIKIIVDIPNQLTDDEKRAIQGMQTSATKAPLVMEFAEKAARLLKARR